MSPTTAADPILKRFRAALDEIYGDRLERVVLYGSRARHCSQRFRLRLAVFLKDLRDGDAVSWRELYQLADLGTEILHETGELVNAMPYRAGSYNDERIPLMHEIRADGIDL